MRIMSVRFANVDRQPPRLLSPDLRDWLSGNHLARCVLLVALLALSGAGCATWRPTPPQTPPALARGKIWKPVRLMTTGYCACQSCCSWKYKFFFFCPVFASGPHAGDPKQVGVTARGTKARHGTLAADTRIFPFGTVMFIPGYGLGVVEDRGGAIQGYHIDLFFERHAEALEWGRKRDLTVQVETKVSVVPPPATRYKRR